MGIAICSIRREACIKRHPYEASVPIDVRRKSARHPAEKNRLALPEPAYRDLGQHSLVPPKASLQYMLMRQANLQLVITGSLPHLLSLPDNIETSDRQWPLLCFLHGYDEGAPTPIEEGLTRHGPLNPRSAAMAVEEFIVAAPQLPVRGNLWHRFADAILELANQLHAIYRIDADRIFLTGFSFGGNGVFDIANRQRNRWAALWAVDPTHVPNEDPACPVWLSSGEVSRRQGRTFIERLKLERLQNGIPGLRVYDDEGQDHVGTATLAYRDERIYRWLLSHPRSQPMSPPGN